MVIAIHKSFHEILADQQISDEECQQIISLVFSASEPESQVNLSHYGAFKQNMAPYLGSTPDNSTDLFIQDATPEDGFNENEHSLKYLYSAFPGNKTLFARNLESIFSISLPENSPQLLEFDFEDIYSPLDTPHLICFAIQFRGEPLNFTYNLTTKKLSEDLSQGQHALFRDVTDYLGHCYLHNSQLTESQASCLLRYMESSIGFPNHAQSLSMIIESQNELTGNGAIQIFPDIEESRPDLEKISFESLGEFPDVSTDHSIENLESTLLEVQDLLPDNHAKLLKEHNIEFVFMDFNHFADRSQSIGTELQLSVLDFYEATQGIFDPLNRTIYVNTRSSRSQQLITTIHEIGHAINHIIQEESHMEVLQYDIPAPLETLTSSTHVRYSGAQLEVYSTYATAFKSYHDDPSLYATSNENEWFAEWYTHCVLEDSGNLTLLRSRIDVNPLSLLSPYLVNPEMYFIMKIIMRILSDYDDSRSSRASYEKLLQTGLSTELRVFTLDLLDRLSGLPGQEKYLEIQQQLEENPEHPQSDALDTLTYIPSIYSLSRIHEMYRTPEGHTAPYEATILSNYENREDPEIQKYYLPTPHGQFSFGNIAYSVFDHRALSWHIQWIQDDMTEEDKIELLIENRILSPDAKTTLVTQLRFLPSQVLDPIFADPELITKAQERVLEENYAYSFLMEKEKKETLTREAQSLLTRGEIELSLKTFEQILELDPNYPDARRGQFVARSVLELDIEPNRMDELLALGDYYLSIGDIRHAKKTYRQARRVYPEEEAPLERLRQNR